MSAGHADACNNRCMLTSQSRLSCVEAADFVLTEIERFQKLFQSGASFTETFGDSHSSLTEFMSNVRHSDTGREYTCGREGLKCFRKIAAVALRERDDAEDFDESEVAEKLRNTFLSYVFARPNEPLDRHFA